jgi:hypothetical protein
MIQTIFIKRSTTTKMELYELESAKRFVMKPMEIKGHNNVKIGSGWKSMKVMMKIFGLGTNITWSNQL